MKKREIKNEWERLIFESMQNKPNIEGVYPFSIVQNRELLLFAQVELRKTEARTNIKFHTEMYRTLIKHYFQQKNV